MADLTPMPNAALVLSLDQGKAMAAALVEASQLTSRMAAELIERLDQFDGDPDDETDDPDLEPIGDEADGAWVEWDTMRGSQKRGPNILPTYNEDDEDDDPAGGEIDEDTPGFTAADLKRANAGAYGAGCPIADAGGCQHDGREPDEGVLAPAYGADQTKGPLPIDYVSERKAIRQHRDRIRRERCDKIVRYGVAEYTLRQPEGG